jgi:hypothetical protein
MYLEQHFLVCKNYYLELFPVFVPNVLSEILVFYFVSEILNLEFIWIAVQSHFWESFTGLFSYRLQQYNYQ